MRSLFPGNTFLLFLKDIEIDHENAKSGKHEIFLDSFSCFCIFVLS